MKQQIFNSRSSLRRALRKLGVTRTDSIIRKWEKDPNFPVSHEGVMKTYNLKEVLVYAVGPKDADILFTQYLSEDGND